MNIILLGFMGTGKTSVGKKLSGKLSMHYIDTDEMIEKEVKLEIWRIFAEFGEQYFREIEKKAIEKVSKLDNYVISTGGGMVLFEENIKNLKKHGKLICLTASPEEIYKRIEKETHRPLLKTPDAKTKIRELLKLRAPLYAKADHIIDTTNLNVDEVVEKIEKLIR
ncbi:shikimate kinase [Candidatus Micrarchaeota archaeon]|nr:shikimate kinase [Candidatus Micrarchaeota archaeon]